MTGINNIKTWKLRTITPLHVGEGEELVRDMDYISHKNGLRILEVDSMIEKASEIRGAVNEIGKQDFDLNRFLDTYRISPVIKYDLSYSGNKTPTFLKSFLKDAFDRPYIPGSSLKGAFRTAIKSRSLKNSKLPQISSMDFEKKEKGLFGENPHSDFIRPLQVSDSNLADPGQVLKALEVNYLNILKGDRPGWIDFASKGRENKPNPKEAFGVVAEVIGEEQEFYLTTSLESFLGDDSLTKAAKIPKFEELRTYQQFCKAINAHSLEIVTKEKRFFEQFGAATREVTDFYDGLKKKILEASNSEDTIIARLAWGSGWKGMTGDWIGDKDLDEIRKRKNLGKTGCPYCGSPKVFWNKEKKILECRNKNCKEEFSEKWIHHIFPKTRRLVYSNNASLVPLGWVELTVTERDKFHNSDISSAYPEEKEVSSEQASGDNLYSGKSSKSQEEINREKIEDFNKFLNGIKNIAGQIDEIEKWIKTVEEPYVKKEMVQNLIKLVKQTSNYKKAKKLGKAWIKRINALADDNNVTFE